GCAAFVDGLRHEPFDDRRRNLLGAGSPVAAHFDRAENRRLERGLMLFDIQRDLHVRNLAAQRAHEPEQDEPGDHRERRDTESRYRERAESQRVQAVGGDDEREQDADDDGDPAAKQRLRPPAVSNFADDVEELFALTSAGSRISHGISPVCTRAYTYAPTSAD